MRVIYDGELHILCDGDDICAKMDQTCTAYWPRSRRSRSRRIALPLAIAAFAALCTSTVAALPQPQVTAPASLESLSTLVVDDGRLPQVSSAAALTLVSGAEELRRRADDDKAESKSTAEESHTSAASKKASSTSSAESSGSSSDSSASSGDGASKPTPTSSGSASQTTSALPEPFDTPLPGLFEEPGLSNSKCPSLILDLLANPTFKKCYPISMLMQVSLFGRFHKE